MIKTNEHNVSFNDLTVDTAGLQALTHAGIKTATEIGVAAGAKIYVGRRVLWNVAKSENIWTKSLSNAVILWEYMKTCCRGKKTH